MHCTVKPLAVRNTAAAVAFAILALSTAPSAHSATSIDKVEVDVAAYPELSSDALLPAIIGDLKQELADPYSIRDLTICPARSVKLRDGRPYSWVVDFALNARGKTGGYDGLTSFVIAFKQGRITLHASAAKFNKESALDTLINRANLKRFAPCERVPNAKVQALLEGEAEPAK